MTMGWRILLLWLLFRNGKVGLGDSQCSCDVDGTRRKGRRGMDGRWTWFLGLRCSFTWGRHRFLGRL